MNLCNNIKCTNIHITGVPEGKGRERKTQKTYMKNNG